MAPARAVWRSPGETLWTKVWGMRRASLALLMIVVAIPSHPAEFHCDWLRRQPAVTGVESEDIGQEDIYEISDSAEAAVEAGDLRDRVFVPLTSAQASGLTNGRFREQQGKRPYLMRAVYWRHENKRSVSHIGDEVLISLTTGDRKACATGRP